MSDYIHLYSFNTILRLTLFHLLFAIIYHLALPFLFLPFVAVMFKVSLLATMMASYIFATQLIVAFVIRVASLL